MIAATSASHTPLSASALRLPESAERLMMARTQASAVSMDEGLPRKQLTTTAHAPAPPKRLLYTALAAKLVRLRAPATATAVAAL